MPLKKGSLNIPMRPELITRLKQKYDERKKANPAMVPDKLGTFINDLVELYLDKEDFLATISPNLDYRGQGVDVLFIKDHRKGKTAEIYLKEGELWCDLDRSNNCDHVHYALAIPEVARLPIKRPSTR